MDRKPRVFLIGMDDEVSGPDGVGDMKHLGPDDVRAFPDFSTAHLHLEAALMQCRPPDVIVFSIDQVPDVDDRLYQHAFPWSLYAALRNHRLHGLLGIKMLQDLLGQAKADPILIIEAPIHSAHNGLPYLLARVPDNNLLGVDLKSSLVHIADPIWSEFSQYNVLEELQKVIASLWRPD
ncbi:MAG: hypothetical protein NTY61_01110 [Candidatus Parcubacteria bacterium]|nr:hypothetical protein [Candidatus Parcubacteria bacterium]